MKKQEFFDVLSRRKTTLDCSSVKSAVADLRKYFSRVHSCDLEINSHSSIWTGGDGFTYKDVSTLVLMSRNPYVGPPVKNSSNLIWETLQSVRGIKTGMLTPEFKSSDAIPAIRKGNVFFAIGNKSLYIGSTVRFGKSSRIHDWADTV